MIGPGESLRRIALAPEEIWLPWAVGGHARNLVDLGLVSDGVGRIGCSRGDNEIDLVPEDELGCHFGGSASAGLAVLADDLHGIGAPANLQPRNEKSPHLIENECIGL